MANRFAICPECKQGKCRNCTGDTLDPDLDDFVPCACDCGEDCE